MGAAILPYRSSLFCVGDNLTRLSDPYRKKTGCKQASVSYKEITTMTTGDKGELFILFVPLFTLSLRSTQQDCVLPVFIPIFFR